MRCSVCDHQLKKNACLVITTKSPSLTKWNGCMLSDSSITSDNEWNTVSFDGFVMVEQRSCATFDASSSSYCWLVLQLCTEIRNFCFTSFLGSSDEFW